MLIKILIFYLNIRIYYLNILYFFITFLKEILLKNTFIDIFNHLSYHEHLPCPLDY
jgi:hypothetical protein